MDSFCLQVTGDYACFTRPEFKVERVSYEIMTPSAARAIVESIFWKPEIKWAITAIEVLKPIKWTTIRRNELASKISDTVVNRTQNSGDGYLIQDINDDRIQRSSLLLQDVSYRIHFTLHVNSRHNPNKYREMFLRRASKGQCFHQPYLGCREFACAFSLVDTTKPLPPATQITKDLGWMLYDLNYSDPQNPKPMFFNGKLENGILHVPHPTSSEVKQ